MGSPSCPGEPPLLARLRPGEGQDPSKTQKTRFIIVPFLRCCFCVNPCFPPARVPKSREARVPRADDGRRLRNLCSSCSSCLSRQCVLRCGRQSGVRFCCVLASWGPPVGAKVAPGRPAPTPREPLRSSYTSPLMVFEGFHGRPLGLFFRSGRSLRGSREPSAAIPGLPGASWERTW